MKNASQCISTKLVVMQNYLNKDSNKNNINGENYDKNIYAQTHTHTKACSSMEKQKHLPKTKTTTTTIKQTH